MNYIIVGPLPPPLGGISVYVERRSRQLRDAGHAVTNIDMARAGFVGKLTNLARIIADPRPMTVDIHAFDFSAMGAALLRPFAKTVTYMDHNTLLYGRDLTGLRAMILRRFLARADQVAFVSREGMQFYEKNGFRFRNALVQNAYLSPPLADEEAILAGYSAETRKFLAERRPLLVANASQIVFTAGQDLYGLDLCVDLILTLRNEFPNIGLLFALADQKPNSEYLQKVRERISAEGAQENFHFLTGQQQLWPVFRKASLMLRPTSGDGFAVSIAEALGLGCPVLASDAVERPPESTLFKNRNSDDFAAKARALLAPYRAGAQ